MVKSTEIRCVEICTLGTAEHLQHIASMFYCLDPVEEARNGDNSTMFMSKETAAAAQGKQTESDMKAVLFCAALSVIFAQY